MDEVNDLRNQLDTLNRAYAPWRESCGVGMLLELARDGEVYVADLVPDMPAAMCGAIQVNDILYRVDTTYIDGWELNDVRQLVLGREDTPVTFEFSRPSTGGTTFKLTLYRDSGVPPIINPSGNVKSRSLSRARSAQSRSGTRSPSRRDGGMSLYSTQSSVRSSTFDF